MGRRCLPELAKLFRNFPRNEIVENVERFYLGGGGASNNKVSGGKYIFCCADQTGELLLTKAWQVAQGRWDCSIQVVVT